MAGRLGRKLRGYRIPTRVFLATAEQLPLKPDSFDYVVSTLVLCTVRDPAGALAEVRRVLKSHGQLLLIEHVRSDDPKLACWQDRLRRPWSWFGHGCQCNRDTVENIRAAGFSTSELRRDNQLKVLPIVRPLVIGAAKRARRGRRGGSLAQKALAGLGNAGKGASLGRPVRSRRTGEECPLSRFLFAISLSSPKNRFPLGLDLPSGIKLVVFGCRGQGEPPGVGCQVHGTQRCCQTEPGLPLRNTASSMAFRCSGSAL